MSNITLPQEYNWVDLSNKHFYDALDYSINSNRNIFCQAAAGYGKSLLIKLIASLKKNVVVLSTTGTTAMELCSDKIAAKTIHSFLSIPPVPIFRSHDLLNISPKNRKILNSANVIIIDEVSMMSNNLFDFICEKIVLKRDDHEIPQLILFGDVMQLSPVIENNQIVKDFYDKEYDGKVMFFNSKYYNTLNFKTLFLRKSYRQTDEDFSNHLFEIGYKDHTKETLDYFNQRVMSLKQYEQQHRQYIYMTPTNKIVDKINDDYIRTLTGKAQTYKATMSKGFPTEKQLNATEVIIKLGAQVMCLMNSIDYKDTGVSYSNGMIGEVINLDSNCVTIELVDGTQRNIGKSTLNTYELKVNSNGNIEYESSGWFKQIDCKISRAITIHKSQGKSIDAAYVSLQNWIPNGLTYVALSRLRSLDGLGLSRPLVESDIKINEESYEFLTC